MVKKVQKKVVIKKNTKKIVKKASKIAAKKIVKKIAVKRDLGKESLALHKELGGKLRIIGASKVKNRNGLSLLYTPGVAAVSSHLAEKPEDAHIYTMKRRMIAVVSDGSAVLGLGNIGPYGALPVMEGKAMLFKAFADVDAVPIVLDTQNVDEIVDTIAHIAPAFGGINLEDISAPRCFEVEEKLRARLSIPVFHDDQHGTAVVVLAALLNAAKVVKKDFVSLKVVLSGAGAAGTAIAKLLVYAGIPDVIVCDRQGTLSVMREDLNKDKAELLSVINPRGVSGSIAEALDGADVFIGVSGPNIISAEHIARMAPKAIVFALANPVPEIDPEEAKKAGAAVVGTGRSDYQNQINNVLVFPGIFRGALDNKVSAITDDMQVRAARNLAALVGKPTAEKIIPAPFDKGVAAAVAKAIK